MKSLSYMTFMITMLLVGHQLQAAVEPIVFYPGHVPTPAVVSSEAFAFEAASKDLLVNFTNITDRDNYIHLDMGNLPLASLGQGGYLEMTASIDKPVIKCSALVAVPGDTFWTYRQSLEDVALMKTGEHVYRFYLDSIRPERLTDGRDHLYLFFQGLGSKVASHKATVRITNITLHPQVSNWREEKRQTYSKQYNWPTSIQHNESLYREVLDRAVAWSPLAGNPVATNINLNGQWKMQSMGQKFWDDAFLADTHFAQADFDDSQWPSVQIPQPCTPGQPVGHTWYRKQFKLDPQQSGQRVYLRLDRLADEARIYLNGQLVGSQVQTEKQIEWIVENGSRFKNMAGRSANEIITWRHFDRCGIAFPFDPKVIPTDRNILPLPLYSGDYDWPLAYDVTDLLRDGGNTLSLRLFANPMHEWWIYKHRTEGDRDKGIFGILGNVSLLAQKIQYIDRFTRLHPVTVQTDGNAQHQFTGTLKPTAQGAARVVLTCDGKQVHSQPATQAGNPPISLILPANFETHRVQMSVLDDQDRILDEQTLTFHGVVVEVRDGKLRVNGEPFLVRGINSDMGIDWDNDRTFSRENFRLKLKLYKQLGFNTLRLERAQKQNVIDAMEQGFMVMPIVTSASTDRSILAFGQYVEPDMALAVDRHRLMALNLSECSNVLLWNTGNEMHHTAGYDDRPVLEQYLKTAQQVIGDIDPYRHMTTFANLDSWGSNWFFLDGQDVIGHNTYSTIPTYKQILKEISQHTDKSFLYCEWGTYAGKKDRDKDIDQWEKDMRSYWELLSDHSRSLGGFLFPHHGAMDDARGRAFYAQLFNPLKVLRKGNSIELTNGDLTVMRQLTVRFVNNDNVEQTVVPTDLSSGQTLLIPFASLTEESAQVVITIDYVTHHGLKHHLLKMLF